MRESEVEKYFVKECKKLGMRAIKMLPTFESGIPDRQILFQGNSGFAEIKAPGKKPRALQVAYLKSLREAGFYVGVVDSKDSAESWLEGFLEHIRNNVRSQSFCAMCGKSAKDA